MRTKNAKLIVLLIAICAFCLSFINLLHKDRLEIYFQASSGNFFQIFYQDQKDGSQFSSERRIYPEGENVRVLFTHDQPSFGSLRLDPFDGTSNIVLKKIAVSSFFYTSDLSGEALFKRLKTIQMLEPLRMEKGGVILTGNSYDPIAVVNLENLERKFDYKNFLIWIISSLFLFVLCLKASAERKMSNRKVFQISLISLIPALVIAYVFYPGFMTYDSLHALRASRSSVTDSIWPPMVSYIWRLVDSVSSDPVVMLFAQVWLFFFSLLLLMQLLTRRLSFSIGIVALSCCVPVLLGTIGAIWKDVLMAGLLLASMVLAFQIKRATSVSSAVVYFMFSAVVMLLAASSRHNAITAVVPIALYAAWALIGKLKISSESRRIVIACLLGMATVVSVYGGKIFFDKYSVPELKPLAGTGSFTSVVRGMDMFAASLCLNQNLLKEHSPKLSLDDISKNFDPRHSNNSLTLFSKTGRLDSKEFNDIWWSTMRHHPFCFLSNKYLLAKYALGADSQEQFLLMTPVINVNEFGYFLANPSIRNYVIQYVDRVSDMVFLRPWVFFLLSFPAMVVVVLNGQGRCEHFVLFSSSMLYALGFFMFGNAADARLLFYSNALNFVLVCIALNICFRHFFFSSKVAVSSST